MNNISARTNIEEFPNDKKLINLSNFDKVMLMLLTVQGWSCSSVVEYLPNKCEVLGSFPNNTEKRKEN